MKFLQRHRLVGIAQVEQVVRHPGPLLGGGLSGSYVHLPIELAGIHVDHRQSEPFGQLKGEAGFAAGGRSQQGDHERFFGHRLSWKGCSPVGDGAPEASAGRCRHPV